LIQDEVEGCVVHVQLMTSSPGKCWERIAWVLDLGVAEVVGRLVRPWLRVIWLDEESFGQELHSV